MAWNHSWRPLHWLTARPRSKDLLPLTAALNSSHLADWPDPVLSLSFNFRLPVRVWTDRRSRLSLSKHDKIPFYPPLWCVTEAEMKARYCSPPSFILFMCLEGGSWRMSAVGGGVAMFSWLCFRRRRRRRRRAASERASLTGLMSQLNMRLFWHLLGADKSRSDSHTADAAAVSSTCRWHCDSKHFWTSERYPSGESVIVKRQ